MTDARRRMSEQEAEAIMECLDALNEGEESDADWYRQPDGADGWAVYLEVKGQRYCVVPHGDDYRLVSRQEQP